MNFQKCVSQWVRFAFGSQIAMNRDERNFRFLEEAVELVQATGMSENEAFKVLRYVYKRPKGQIHQEIGGVMVTLAALCESNGYHMDQCGEDELFRALRNTEDIRMKQSMKREFGVSAY